MRLSDLKISPVSPDWRQKARAYLDTLAIPRGSLGGLLDLAEQLAAIQQTLQPKVDNKVIVTMAGDHGVCDEGVSAFPQSVTPQMVDNFVRGGAAINVLSRVAGARVVIADLGIAADMSALTEAGSVLDRKVAFGTRNMAKGQAMTRKDAIAAIEAGINIAHDLIADGANLLGTGDMGIGNTTPSSAILSVLADIPVSDATGKGTGIDDAAFTHKIETIEKAIALNRPNKSDPIDVLSKIGGLEIGGIAGLILGAAQHSTAVVVDGFISTAGALIAKAIAPECAGYMIASHRSVEAGHIHMWRALGLSPLLDLNLRLGEGTGAALAMNIVESAAQVIGKVLTFEQAGVDKNA